MNSKQKWILNRFFFLQVFRIEVWMLVVVMITAFTVGLLAMTPHIEMSLSTSLHQIFSIMLLKTTVAHRNLLSYQILVYIGEIFAFLLFIHYSALLTSFMTFRPPPQSIDSFEMLLKQGYEVFIWDSSPASEYFRTADQGSAMYKVYQKMKNTNNTVFSSHQAMHILESQSNAVFYGSQMTFFGLKNTKHIRNFEEKIRTYASVALQKDSEFVDLFDYHIIQLMQTGISHRIWSNWTSRGLGLQQVVYHRNRRLKNQSVI